MSEHLKMIGVLFAVCVASSLVLSLVYSQTQPLIEANSKKELDNAILRVQPQAEDVQALGISKGAVKEVYGLSKAGENVGYAVLVESSGYQGAIRVIYGLDAEQKIIGIEVLSHSETPGLGSKIQDSSFLGQFLGKGKADLSEVDTITGATVSSSAVLRVVTESIDVMREVAQ